MKKQVPIFNRFLGKTFACLPVSMTRGESRTFWWGGCNFKLGRMLTKYKNVETLSPGNGRK